MPNTMPDLDHDEKYIDTGLQIKDFGSNTMPIYGGEKKSDDQAENKYASMQLADYVDFCRAYVGPEFLSENLLKQRLAYILQDSSLKSHFRAGEKVCIVPIPCSENGFPLEPAELANGMYLRNLILDESDLVSRGFSKSNCNIFKLMPLEVRQQLVFTVPAYENTDETDISPTDRANIVELYEAKYRAAQQLFLSHAA